MNQKQILSRLQKTLGKRAAYRVDDDAMDADERAAVKEQLPALSAAYTTAKEARDARRRAVLAADAEYQALCAEAQRTEKAHSEALSTYHHYRITAGVLDVWFTIRAEGDTWDEVFAKLETKP